VGLWIGKSEIWTRCKEPVSLNDSHLANDPGIVEGENALRVGEKLPRSGQPGWLGKDCNLMLRICK
jgi:hypothetical protein